MAKNLLTKEDFKTPLEEAPTEADTIDLLAEEAPKKPSRTNKLGLLGKLAKGAAETPLVASEAGGRELANLLLGAGTLPINIARGLVGKQYRAAPQLPAPQIEKQYPIASGIGRLGGGAVGYGLTEMGAAPAKIAETLTPLLGKGAQLAAEAVPGAIYGGAQAPETPGKGAILGGALGAGLGVAGRGLSKAGKAAAKRAEIYYPQAKEAINDILTKLRGSSSVQESNSDIFNYADRHHDELVKEETKEKPLGERLHVKKEDSIPEAYRVPKEMAKKEGININREHYKAKMDKVLKEEEEEGAIYEEPRSEDLALQKYIKQTKNMKINSFDNVDIAKRKLNKDYESFKYEDPRRMIIMRAQDALQDTLKESVKDNPKIKELWNLADEKYTEKALPFIQLQGGSKWKSPFALRKYRDKPISGFTDAYIKPGDKKDQVELTKNILHMMPNQEAKDLVAYDYMKGTEDNPETFMKKYLKLGENQKEALFSRHKQEIDKMAQEYKKNPALFKEPSKVKGTLVKAAMNAPKYLGLAGIASGHIPAGLALLAAPTAERAGLNLLGRRAGKEALSPEVRSLLMSEILGKLGGNR